MKYLILFLFPALVFAADAKPKKLEMQWRPNCKKAKLADYMASYETCLKQGNSDDVCKCMANGFVMEPGCDVIKKFKTDQRTKNELGRRVVMRCKPMGQKASPTLKK